MMSMMVVKVCCQRRPGLSHDAQLTRTIVKLLCKNFARFAGMIPKLYSSLGLGTRGQEILALFVQVRILAG